MKLLFVVAMLLLSIQNLSAGGFLTYLMGNRQAGMGVTGAGYATDAATIAFNPGGLAMLKGNNIYGGMHWILARTNWVALQPSASSASMENNISTPFQFYANYKYSDSSRIGIGLGVYTPFGSSITWPADWEGRMVIQEIGLKTIFFQPTISYAFTEKISIGAGFIYATGDINLQKALPVLDKDLNEGSANLKGNSNGVGFNAGLYFKPSEILSIGVSYRSNVLFKITDGSAAFQVPASLIDSFPPTSFKSEINLPFVATVGFAFKPLDNLTFAFDGNYTGWSSYDSLVFDYTYNTSLLTDTRSGKKFENSFTFRMGIEYQIKSFLALRIGGYYDKSPVPDDYLSPETPDSDRMGLTAGVGINLAKNLSINGSMIYIEGAKRTAVNVESGFGGTYKSKIAIPGLSIQYTF